MMTQIAITAGDIWLVIDKHEGIDREALFSRLKQAGRTPDLLLMALGWLIYQKHVKWIPGENGGSFVIANRHCAESGITRHSTNQGRLALKGELY